MSWSAVIPVRSWGEGKTRLGTHELIRAFTQDVAAALADSPAITEIIVTSADPQVQMWAKSQGLTFIRDVDAELNAALLTASPQGSVAYFLADVPCLRPDDVSRLIATVTGPSFVADTAGTGTTCAFFPAGTARSVAFGERSRAAHRARGMHEMGEIELGSPAAARVRRDVDTRVDLWDAIRLGVGAHTQAMLATITSQK